MDLLLFKTSLLTQPYIYKPLWNVSNGSHFYNKFQRTDGKEELKIEDLKEEKEEDVMDKYEHLVFPEMSDTGRSSGIQTAEIT